MYECYSEPPFMLLEPFLLCNGETLNTIISVIKKF